MASLALGDWFINYNDRSVASVLSAVQKDIVDVDTRVTDLDANSTQLLLAMFEASDFNFINDDLSSLSIKNEARKAFNATPREKYYRLNVDLNNIDEYIIFMEDAFRVCAVRVDDFKDIQSINDANLYDPYGLLGGISSIQIVKYEFGWYALATDVNGIEYSTPIFIGIDKEDLGISKSCYLMGRKS